MNEKFQLWMRRQIINRCLEIIDRDGGMSPHKHADLLADMKVDVMGCEVPDVRRGSSHTHFEQRLYAAWRFRRDQSIELAKTLRLFVATQRPVVVEGKDIYVSLYATTWRGRLYRWMPKYVQIAFLGVCVWGQRVSATANRFKWVVGMASFGALAVKVWHSGLISNGWIAISLAIGVVFGLLASLWG